MRALRRRIWASLALALCPAGSASAVGLDSVEIQLSIVGTAGTDALPTGTMTVKGESSFKTVTVKIGAASIGSLSCTSGSCTGALTVAAALPPDAATNFTLEIENDDDPDPDITATVAYTPPPSPKISSPAHQAKIDPGPAEVQFAAFTACTNTTAGCSTHGKLEKTGVATPLADQDVVPNGSSTWKPTNANGAVDFPGESDLTVTIEHRVDQSKQSTATGDTDGFTFRDLSTHSDKVTFSTNSAPPSGDFCIAVNDSGASCTAGTAITLVDEPAAGILDTSGKLTPTPGGPPTAAGFPFEYTLQLAPNGKLSGIAAADLDGVTGFEVPADLVGRLKGKDGQLRQKTRLRFDDGTSDTRFKVRLREEAELATIQVSGVDDLAWLVEQKTNGKANGEKLSERATGTRTVAGAVTGWRLEFTLTGTEGPISGSLTLANGVSVALAGRHRFDGGSNLSDVELASEGTARGVLIRVKKLQIGAASQTDPTQTIKAGLLRFRAFGQRGSALLK